MLVKKLQHAAPALAGITGDAARCLS